MTSLPRFPNSPCNNYNHPSKEEDNSSHLVDPPYIPATNYAASLSPMVSPVEPPVIQTNINMPEPSVSPIAMCLTQMKLLPVNSAGRNSVSGSNIFDNETKLLGDDRNMITISWTVRDAYTDEVIIGCDYSSLTAAQSKPSCSLPMASNFLITICIGYEIRLSLMSM